MTGWPLAWIVLTGLSQEPSATFGALRQALTHCFSPPAHTEGSVVTVRFSLRRDGAVFGRPKVTYLKLAGRPDDQAAFERAVAASLNACTPVRLDPDFAAVIAGQPLTILFSGDGQAPVLRGF